MQRFTLQPKVTWAEDRATVRTDPSADPRAKTGVEIGLHRSVSLPSHPLRDWHQSDKPSRQEAVILRQDAFPFANASRAEFQFTVNQDSVRRLAYNPVPLVVTPLGSGRQADSYDSRNRQTHGRDSRGQDRLHRPLCLTAEAPGGLFSLSWAMDRGVGLPTRFDEKLIETNRPTRAFE